MEAPAVKQPVPSKNQVNTDTINPIKNLSNDRQRKQRQQVIITKCLSQPCPIYYTDSLSESILIECKDPRHNQNERMSFPNSSFKYNKKEAGKLSARPNKAGIERLGTKPEGKSWNI